MTAKGQKSFLNKILNWIIFELAWITVWLWQKSIRIRYTGIEALPNPGNDKKTHYQPSPGQAKVLAQWHENLVLSLFCYFDRKPPIVGLISQSKDGEIAAKFVQRMGHLTVRGSSSRGGASALTDLYQKVRDGFYPLITVDGPRGPCHVPKPGAMKISSGCDVGLIPVRFFVSRSLRLKSWDKLHLPYPFSTIDAVYGDPVKVTTRIEPQGTKTIYNTEDLAEAINSIPHPYPKKTGKNAQGQDA